MTLVLNVPQGTPNEIFELQTLGQPVRPLLSDLTALLVAELPLIQIQLGWAATTGGLSNLLVLFPAGHTPGAYFLGSQLDRLVAAGAGTANRTIAWNAPGAKPSTIVAPVALNALGILNTASAPIVSDGSAPITMQFVGVGIVAPLPTLDIYGFASLTSRLP